MKGLAKRVIRQIAGDKRTIAMLVLAPIFIMTLLSLLLGNVDYTPTIAVWESKLPPAMVAALEEQDVHIVNIAGLDANAEQYLKDNKDIDAVFSISENGSEITMYESSGKSGAALKAIQRAAVSVNPAAELRTHFVIGNPDNSFFESRGYVFFGIVSFFLIFIVSGMALVRERSGGTLERMLMTPITRAGAVGGYTVGYGLFAAIQAVILVVFGIYALGLHSEGNVLWVVLIMLLLAVAAVAFGEFISIFSNTEFQVVQLIPIAIIPQIFFSGLIPIDTIPYNLGNLCYIMPIYYGCTAIKEVMVLGNGFGAILPFISALSAYIAVLSVANIALLKKYRKL
jgi:ABC-2 type transport system permease protein